MSIKKNDLFVLPKTGSTSVRKLQCLILVILLVGTSLVGLNNKAANAQTISEKEQGSKEETGLTEGDISSEGDDLGDGEGFNDDDISFDDEFEFLEDMATVVTATKQEQTVAEAPAIITIISREQIIQRNYRSVAEALNSAPGIFVNNDYVFYDVGLRGISGEIRGGSRLIKVMINGQPVSFRSETTNLIGPELIPIDIVERIEIIRGPVSALYGANAFLGVVNIITVSGEKARRTSIFLGSSLFKDMYGGFEFGLATGHKLGPVDILLAFSKSHLDRSGLRIRCTTAIEGETPCHNFSSINEALLNRSSFDDIAKPLSFLSTVTFKLKDLFGVEGDADFGEMRFLGNIQMLDSRGSFSDWGVLNYDFQENSAGEVFNRIPGSGNRVALYNGVVRGEYEVGLFDDALVLDTSVAYAQGGASDTERLRELSGYATRSQYGFEAYDFAFNYMFSILDSNSENSSSKDEKQGAFVGNLNLLGGVDYGQDNIQYVEDAGATPVEYSSAHLRNIGFWSQITGDILDQRIGFIAGARYDIHKGAEVSDEKLSFFEPEERERLCGNSVCYNQLSYRAGTTFLALRNVGTWGEEDENGNKKHVLDTLFFKVLYGTAFKAPSPMFLYNEDFLGERPLNPNPTLLPQKINSLEAHVGSAFWDRMINLSITFYYNVLKEKAEFSRQGIAIIAKNGATTNTVGFEGEIRFHWAPFFVYGNMFYQNSWRELGENSAQRIVDTFGFPDFSAKGGASYHLEDYNLKCNLEFQYIGKRIGHPVNRTDREHEKYDLDPYFVMDLNIVKYFRLWDEKSTRIMFSVKNILNTRYDYPGFQPYYRIDIPGQPRIIMLSLSQEL
jgi:iron complex outermembrane receptor protein